MPFKENQRYKLNFKIKLLQLLYLVGLILTSGSPVEALLGALVLLAAKVLLPNSVLLTLQI